jgi:hypothetical protein
MVLAAHQRLTCASTATRQRAARDAVDFGVNSMTPEHEKYVHLQECITSLNAAWSVVESLQITEADKTLKWAAIRMALIEYAKPYKRSRGVHSKNYVMQIPELSEDDKRLHSQIITLRDKMLAHSDLDFKEAKLYLGKIGNNVLPLIISTNIEPQLPSLDSIKGLIERTLDKLYEQLPIWEQRMSDSAQAND